MHLVLLYWHASYLTEGNGLFQWFVQQWQKQQFRQSGKHNQLQSYTVSVPLDNLGSFSIAFLLAHKHLA